MDLFALADKLGLFDFFFFPGGQSLAMPLAVIDAESVLLPEANTSPV